ncbi:MAG TPA: hypothetical protein VHR66_10240 [Gemmataceae bacterium]|nr:hypothetical protein [Gemmataceae bacterium]
MKRLAVLMLPVAFTSPCATSEPKVLRTEKAGSSKTTRIQWRIQLAVPDDLPNRSSARL